MTFQPILFNSRFASRSLATFLSNFAAQKLRFLFGSAKSHLGHLCQKHPCTKTTNLFLGKTKSGDPGKSLLLIFFRRSLERSSSGFVPEDTLDRIDFDTLAETARGVLRVFPDFRKDILFEFY